MKNIQSYFKSNSRRAQGLVEYIILVGLIGLLCFAAVKALGSNISNAFNHASSKVSESSGM
jgi:Flp pilus assembly pilin Flp